MPMFILFPSVGSYAFGAQKNRRANPAVGYLKQSDLFLHLATENHRQSAKAQKAHGGRLGDCRDCTVAVPLTVMSLPAPSKPPEPLLDVAP